MRSICSGSHAEIVVEGRRSHKGTSAGGNRAKAVTAWNPKTQKVRSGQANLRPGFEPWTILFHQDI